MLDSSDVTKRVDPREKRRGHLRARLVLHASSPQLDCWIQLRVLLASAHKVCCLATLLAACVRACESRPPATARKFPRHFKMAHPASQQPLAHLQPHTACQLGMPWHAHTIRRGR